MTIEQADRLVKIGFELPMHVTESIDSRMIKWLATGRKLEIRKYFENWCIEVDKSGETIKDLDLTEALVLACEAVAKGKEGV